jgi:hypothetical protein
MEISHIPPRCFAVLKGFGAAVLFVLIGCVLLFLPSEPIPIPIGMFAWLSIGIGLFVIVSIAIWHRNRTAIILTDVGINVTNTPFGCVPWSEVTHVGIRRIGLVISVKDNLKYFQPLPLWKRCIWWTGLFLPGDLLLIRQDTVAMHLDELFEKIVARVKVVSQVELKDQG